MKLFKLMDGVITPTTANMPRIGEDEVLVKVKAISLNYRDLLVMEGTGSWKPAENRIPGSDAAGEVVEVGANVKKLEVGDRVTTLILPLWEQGKLTAEKLKDSLGGAGRDGVMAEYVALPENTLCRFPDYLSYEEASTLPVAALTAWNAVVHQGTLKVGDSILITGTGGVSLFALQFASLAGYQTIITSGSDKKLAKAKLLGAHHTLNYKNDQQWMDKVMELTDGAGVDQVVDVVGGDHLNLSLQCVKSEGIVSMIGVIDGTKGELDTGLIMTKAARIQGVETGSTAMYRAMLKAMAIHKLKPVIDKVFTFEQTIDAMSYLKEGKHFGKVCIRL